MWLLELIGIVGSIAVVLTAIVVIGLPLAGIFFLLRRSYILAAICFTLFALFLAASALDWRRGEQATAAFGEPQLLAPINRSWPLVLAGNYSGCSPICRQLLVSRQKSVVYGAEWRRGRPRPGESRASIRSAFRLASGDGCAGGGSASTRIEPLGKEAGCIVGRKATLPPANYVRVTVDNFPIEKLYELGFPKTTNTFRSGTFFLLVENVSGGEEKVAAWAARVVREPRSIIPGLSNLTRAGKLQVVGNQEELNPTLTNLLGWSLGEVRSH